MWPFKRNEPASPEPNAAIRSRAEQAERLGAPLSDAPLGIFRAACAGRAGLAGDVMEIHAAARIQDGTGWHLDSNVGALIGTVTKEEVTLRLPDADGKLGETLVSLDRARVDALMDHAARHPVALAAILLLEKANDRQVIGFLGWFWHELAGTKKTDAMYVLRTEDDLIYAMRLGRWGASLYAHLQGRTATEPMATLSKGAVTRAATLHGIVPSDDPAISRRSK